MFDWVNDIKYWLGRECLTIDKKEWCFPSCDEGILVGLQFQNDGTFTQQSILFGAKRSEGTWGYHSEDKILLKYHWSSDYVIPKNQIVKLTSCQNLTGAGGTRYVRN